jgi:hypothetical protein
MDVLRRMRRQDRCAHAVALTVQSIGIERVVCEACGHVSVHFLGGLTGEVDRDRFARPIEREGRHQRADEESEDQPLVDDLADSPVPANNGSVTSASRWGGPERN